MASVTVNVDKTPPVVSAAADERWLCRADRPGERQRLSPPGTPYALMG